MKITELGERNGWPSTRMGRGSRMATQCPASALISAEQRETCPCNISTSPVCPDLLWSSGTSSPGRLVQISAEEEGSLSTYCITLWTEQTLATAELKSQFFPPVLLTCLWRNDFTVQTRSSCAIHTADNVRSAQAKFSFVFQPRLHILPVQYTKYSLLNIQGQALPASANPLHLCPLWS